MRRIGERGEGQWERVTWDEALNPAAKRFAATRAKYGPLSLVGACNNANSGRGVAVVLLLRSLGSPNWMINQDLCGGCRAVSSRATGLDITRGEDIDSSRCALVVGRNSYEADPVEWSSLKALSHGHPQHLAVAIARALAYQPKLLLMDEPFASVDAQTRADPEDLVAAVRRRYRITIVFITHDIDEAAYLSDRVVVLSKSPTTVLDLVTTDLPHPHDQIATQGLAAIR